MSEALYPTIRVSGGPRERGRSYGEQAAARIGRSIALYTDIFAHYAGWEWKQVTEHAERFTEPIAAAHPGLRRHHFHACSYQKIRRA